MKKYVRGCWEFKTRNISKRNFKSSLEVTVLMDVTELDYLGRNFVMLGFDEIKLWKNCLVSIDTR